MTHMRHVFTLLALAAALTTPACDPAADACESPAPVDGDAPGALPMVPPVELDQAEDTITLREQGPPQGLYITALNGKPIGRAGAKAIIDACAKQVDPPQTCSLSWYQPDTSQPTRVLGVGCSMMASYPLWKCYVDFMVSQKAAAY
jgi:hypothetical protein